jgi:hypothetical protein
MLVSLFNMDYLDEYGLLDDDIKAIDEGIEGANKFFSKALNHSEHISTS